MRYIGFIVFFIFCMKVSYAQDVKGMVDFYYPKGSDPGVSIVLKNNDTLIFQAQGMADLEHQTPIDSLTNFRLASVSKQFTAMAIFQLIKLGKVDFDTKVRTLLPELPVSTANINIAQLINHSSGIVDYEGMISLDRTIPLTDKDVLSYISVVDSLYFEPGTTFRYSNTAYCLLALIVERLSEMPFAEAVKVLIFEPLALKTATVYPTAVDAGIRAFGYHPAQSIFHFADQSITSSTKGDGGVYISAMDYNNWLDAKNILFDPSYWHALDDNKILVKDNIYYSLGWFVTYDAAHKPYLFHSGESTGFHNIVFFNPTENQSITIFSNRDDFIIAELFNAFSAGIDQICLPRPLFNWLNSIYMQED